MSNDPVRLARSVAEVHTDFAAREIMMVVVPYDTAATVSDNGGRSFYTESWAPGSFDSSIAKRSDRIRLHRSHDPEAVLGRSIAWPTDAGRLVGVFKVLSTRAGDDALELANEGELGASLEALVRHGWSTWSPDRARVHRTRGELERVALTAIPAYADAKVLSVRSAPGGLGVGVEDPPDDVDESVEGTPSLNGVRDWLTSVSHTGRTTEDGSTATT